MKIFISKTTVKHRKLPIHDKYILNWVALIFIVFKRHVERFLFYTIPDFFLNDITCTLVSISIKTAIADSDGTMLNTELICKIEKKLR